MCLLCYFFLFFYWVLMFQVDNFVFCVWMFIVFDFTFKQHINFQSSMFSLLHFFKHFQRRPGPGTGRRPGRYPEMFHDFCWFLMIAYYLLWFLTFLYAKQTVFWSVKTPQKHPQHTPETYPKHTQNTSQTTPKHFPNIPKTHQTYVNICKEHKNMSKLLKKNVEQLKKKQKM